MPSDMPQIAQTPLVDLAHDLVVAEVLANFVFEGSCFVHAPLPVTELARRRAAWRCGRADCAELPRRRRSPGAWSAPCSAPRRRAPARGTCASPPGLRASETKSARDAPSTCSREAARPINESSPSSSRLTQMRSAWKVRVAGSIRCQPRAATPRRTIVRQPPGGVDGRLLAAPSRWRGPLAATAAPRRTR